MRTVSTIRTGRQRRARLRPVRTALAIGGATALVVVVADPAGAHVTVHSVEAFQGATDAEIVFRVPNEEAKADTTKIEFDLPLNTPIIGVAVEPPTGWIAAVTESKLAKPVQTDDGAETTAVSKILYSGGRILPGDYLDFPISADLLPKAPQLVFKAIQTYSDGTVVSWIDQSAPGAAEAEHPAPTLDLAAAGSGPAAPATAGPAASGASGADAAGVQTLSSELSDKAGKNQTYLALGLAIAALVIGLVGEAVGLSALRRRR